MDTAPLSNWWWGMALWGAIFSAGQMIVAGHFKVDGLHLSWLRCVLVVVLLTPFMVLYMHWPTDPRFYIAVVEAGILATVADAIAMNSSARFGAGVTSRLLPAAPVMGFFLWCAMHPHEQLGKLTSNPIIGAGIVLALMGCVLALSRLRASPVSRQALALLAPVIFLYGLNDTLNKTAQMHAPFGYGQIAYIYVICMTVSLCGALWMLTRGTLPNLHSNPRLVRAAGLIVACYLLAMVGRNFAMFFTLNPGYVSIIGNTAPVMVFLWHKLRGEQDTANPRAGFAFVGCAALLVWLVNHL